MGLLDCESNVLRSIACICDLWLHDGIQDFIYFCQIVAYEAIKSSFVFFAFVYGNVFLELPF